MLGLEVLLVLDILNDYDWAEVFGEGTGGNCKPIQPRRIPGENCSREGFTREDVDEILGMDEKDGPEWVICGKLKDGRFFVAAGSCDYTGWDCLAGNNGNVAETLDSLKQFAMTQEEVSRCFLQEATNAE